MGESKHRNADFYIGYQPEAPASYRRALILFLTALAMGIACTGAIIAFYQKAFSDSRFEFGTITEVQGVLLLDPVPRIVLDAEETVKSVLLVGFGKTGALPAIEEMENSRKVILRNRYVTMRGSLIYGEDKTLLELTEGAESLVEVGGHALRNFGRVGHGTLETSGQIIDPKCYFGVMKPGEGKVHRSCAVRCISGGIPPVLKTTLADGRHRFFILKGPNGEGINSELLPFVADHVAVSGQHFTTQDWEVLLIDPASVTLF